MSGKQSADKIGRRKALQLSGAIAAATCLPTVKGATKSSNRKNPLNVNPNSINSVDNFLRHYHLELESLDKKKTAWNSLNDAQQKVVISRYVSQIELETNHEWKSERGSESEEDVTIQSIPTAYKESVKARFLGNVIYTFNHTIEWRFDSNTVSNWTSSYSGSAPAPDIEYKGLAGTDLNVRSSFFDYQRKGKFSDVILPTSYIAVIKLRGRSDGRGETLKKEHGYIV